MRLHSSHSWVIRLWTEIRATAEPVWRASLTDTSSGRRRHFGDVESLIAYIRETSGAPRPEGES
jgi:hypothetical protein